MKRPITATLALAFVLLNAVVSLIFGILILLGNIPGLPDHSVIQFIMAGTALVGSGLLFVLSFLLIKHNRTAFYITLIVLLFVSILVFADEVGYADWIAFGFSALPAVLLLLSRQWFLTKNKLTNSLTDEQLSN